MEEVDRIGNVVLNEHPPGISPNELGRSLTQIIGDDEGRMFVSQIPDGKLPQGALIIVHLDSVI